MQGMCILPALLVVLAITMMLSPGVGDAAAQAADEKPFVTTWRVDAAGGNVTIPVGNATGTYTISWGDGTIDAGVSGDQHHTYARVGNYTVSIYGDFTRIHLDGHPDAQNLLSIDQWGDMQWTSMASAFRGASNMIYNAADSPDLSSVTNMSRMFYDATAFNGNLSAWDVSSVTDMSGMFWGTYSFDQPLNNWDVSSVTDMHFMLAGSSFNGDISSWDVSSVTDMSGMFYGTLAFNGNLSTWDVSSVNKMYLMFWDAPFNGDISSWDVSSVTNMGSMFRHSPFNGDISSWDVSSVTNMALMFSDTAHFNGDISSWDVSGVTNMVAMFQYSPFNGDISSWDVSSVTDMDDMFRYSKFNGDISSWDVSSVAYMGQMFKGATAFNQNLGNWYVTLDSTSIDRADVPGVVGAISARNAFLDGQNPTYRIEPGGDSDRFTIVDGSRLSMVSAAADRTTYTVTIAATGYLVFEDGNNRRTVEVVLGGAPDEQQAPDHLPFVTSWRTETANQTITIPLVGSGMTIHWGDGTSSTDVAGTTTHRYANPGTYEVSVHGGLQAINLGGHPDASKLVSIDQWGDVQWTTMASAFQGATNMTHMATDEPDLSRVTDMSWMFAGAASFSGNLSTWNVSSVMDMSYMFQGATSFNQPLDSWDVSSVTDMSHMFRGASAFNGDLSAWDVSSVMDMTGMFWNAASFNQPLDSWDVSSVTDMDRMFANATSFDQNIGGWYVLIDSASIDRADIPGMGRNHLRPERLPGRAEPHLCDSAGRRLGPVRDNRRRPTNHGLGRRRPYNLHGHHRRHRRLCL